MVMLGSHCPIIPFPLQEVEEKILKDHEESCQELEYLTTTSGNNQIKSNLGVHVEHSSLSFTRGIQEILHRVTTFDHLVDCLLEIIPEPSYFQSYGDFLSSFPTNRKHQSILNNILCLDFQMEKDKISYYLIEEENLDTQNMTLPLETNKLKLISTNLICCIVTTSPTLTEKDQEDFPVVTQLPCSRKYSHLLLYLEHACVLEEISGLHILEEKNKNVDQSTQGEEVHTQCIKLSIQKYISYSREKDNIKGKVLTVKQFLSWSLPIHNHN
jgi:hypothetical protein